MYDTIVLGNDPASLIAAVVLANHGRKALLLTMEDVPDFFSESGYTFDIDPLPGPA
jgi:predicted flavoprotein YhiN